MPQGLKASLGHFYVLADSIIEVNLQRICEYIDDFIICINSFEVTIHKLNRLLQVFQKHNLTFNHAKCIFHTISVNYLGFKSEDHKNVSHHI